MIKKSFKIYHIHELDRELVKVDDSGHDHQILIDQ